MSLSLLGLLFGLAILDALNPFSIAAQAYLLGTPNPLPRSVAFLVATFVTYFAGGVALLLGLAAALGWVAPLLPAWGWATAEVVLGVALGLSTVAMVHQARSGTPVRAPQNLSILATAVFGVVSTAADVSSAVPLFGAVALIAPLEDWRVQGVALALYVLVYCLPLIALVLARVMLPRAREAIFGALKRGIDWAFVRLLPPLSGLVALGLVVDGVRRLVT